MGDRGHPVEIFILSLIKAFVGVLFLWSCQMAGPFIEEKEQFPVITALRLQETPWHILEYADQLACKGGESEGGDYSGRQIYFGLNSPEHKNFQTGKVRLPGSPDFPFRWRVYQKGSRVETRGFVEFQEAPFECSDFEIEWHGFDVRNGREFYRMTCREELAKDCIRTVKMEIDRPSR